VVALALLLADNRAVIFWQQRVGTGGRLFWFPKFTSMQSGSYALHHHMLALSDHRDSLTFKMRDDPRVTRIGRVIRALSIDELPQLWTVLRGDMSLVGPRPPLPSEVARYTAVQRRRLEVKPGLTCLWQVYGRSLLPFDRQVVLDIEYIDQQCIWLDLKIVLRTIPAVLSCRGAF
jgi:lipopolysaccharide/colanic/teichoic acid biosynthesis glycosyltransferase